MENTNVETSNYEVKIVEDMKELSLNKDLNKNEGLTMESYETESQIRSALNQQTIIQYRQYAAEQHPKEQHKQEELIKQLQEQYFQQYIAQVFEMQKIYQQQQIEQLKNLHLHQIEESGENVDIDLNSLYTPLPLVPANLWTRKDIVEFKADIMRNQRECCIKIGSLSTATVRVPTHPEGKCVFWEFATDYYDLGFGVYFEWNIQPSDNITVHISESSDEEEFEEETAVNPASSGAGDATNVSTSNVNAESGSVTSINNNVDESALDPEDVERGSKSSRRGNNVPCDELIPVYRRDCHLEVYCGSHQYPGRGTYVLKFDNSYSVWRSKYLYYRVYYTK